MMDLDDRLKCSIDPKSENILYLFPHKASAEQAFREYKFFLDIRNEKYKGVYVYGKNKRTKIDGTFKDVPGDDVVRIQDGIPRIVDNETWDKANSIYNERQYKSGGQAKAKEIYLLSGLIYCGLCGGSMCGSKVNSGRSKIPRITYKCNTRKAKKTCNAKDIRRDVIENIVIEELENALSDDGIDEFIDAVLRQAIEMTSEIPVEIKALKSKLKTIDSQIEPMVNAIMDGLYSPSIKEKLSLMEMEKHDYIEKIEFLENRSNSMIKLDNARIKNYLKKDMDIKSKNMDEKKRIIQAHIKKILVFPDHVDIIREVDTNSGAEPYIVVSTYEYKQPINLKPLFIKKKSKIVNNA
jgi:site-specific DNA recombinase